MRIRNNDTDVTIFAGQQNARAQHAQQSAQNAGGNAKKAFYAGDSNVAGTRDLIAQKKAKAQRQAMKVVGDTFAADKAIDDDLQARRDRVHSLKQERLDCQREIDWYGEEQERLRGVYGVTEDSAEQKDLDLLRKCADSKGGATGEERARADEIRARGLTEYQRRVLDLDDSKKTYQAKIDEIDRQVEQENATIEAIRLERLKSDPMVKAQKQAEKIMEAVSDEAVSMVLEDAKEHIDEESEERREQAEKLEEKREEQEKLIEKRRERRDEMEELLEDAPMEELLGLGRKQQDVKQEVQDILNKLKLVAEDIKGAAVDENV